MSEIVKDSEVLMHFSILLADGSAVDSTKVANKPAKFIMFERINRLDNRRSISRATPVLGNW